MQPNDDRLDSVARLARVSLDDGLRHEADGQVDAAAVAYQAA